MQPPSADALDMSKMSRESQLPKKGKYRQRAHCNPLMTGGFAPPVKPSEYDWSQDFPEKHQEAEEKGVPAPTVDYLDIGCGFGGMTIKLAEEFPGKLTLGLEIRAKVSQYVKDRIAALRIKHPGMYQNCSCIQTNTQRHLVQYFGKASVEKILILFADPCFKVSSHRRRIIQRALLDEYAYILKPQGILYCVTDVQDLHEWQKRKLDEHTLFDELSEAETAADPISSWIETETEEAQKVKRNGGNMWKAVYRRR